jgi:hypothetical protein
MDAAIGLAGVALGAVLTIGVNWMNRIWERADRRRETLIARAEELAGFTTELNEWQVECFESALAGKTRPPPWSLFRLQILVNAYLPEVEPRIQELRVAIESIHETCADLAATVARQPNARPAPDLISRVKDAMKGVTTACAGVTDAIGERIKTVNRR